MIHDLKILPEWFNAVISGVKTFEIRKDDRNYQPRDELLLREWDGTAYTGRTCKADVTMVLRGEYCREMYCTMAIRVHGLAEPVRHGSWETWGYVFHGIEWKRCSRCGKCADVSYYGLLDGQIRMSTPAICGGCGARMDATDKNVGGKGGADNA